MKGLSLFLLLFAGVSYCYGQSNYTDYKLTITLAPSFINGSQITIEENRNQAQLQLDIYGQHQKPISTYTAVLATSHLDSLHYFLESYKFRVKGNVDTVRLSKVFAGKDSVIIYHVSAGLDGITVNGKYNRNGDLHHFAFWSPQKGTENSKLMELVFNLLDKSIVEPEAVNYIEQLKQYFPHGLGVKKICNKTFNL